MINAKNLMVRFFVLAALVAGLLTVLSPAKAKATDMEQFNLLKGIDMNAMMFPNTKDGCGMKTAFNMAIINQLADEKNIAQFSSRGGVMQSLVQTSVDRVKAEGVTQASLDNIRDYQSCIRNSKPVPDMEKELKLTSKHAACVQLADVILGTLDGIKGRRKVETMLDRYGNKQINFMDTMYEGYERAKTENMPQVLPTSPIPFLIKGLYDTAEKDSYDAAVRQGSALTVSCYMVNTSR